MSKEGMRGRWAGVRVTVHRAGSGAQKPREGWTGDCGGHTWGRTGPRQGGLRMADGGRDPMRGAPGAPGAFRR